MAINHREGLSGSESVDRSHPAGDVAAHAPASGGIEEVFVVREALDALATQLAVHRIGACGLIRLRLLLESMEEGARTGDVDQVEFANATFHDLIYDAAGNSTLKRLGRAIREDLLAYSTQPYADPDRVEQGVTEHAAIVDALEKCESEAAVKASNHHISKAGEQSVRLQLRALAGTSWTRPSGD